MQGDVEREEIIFKARLKMVVLKDMELRLADTQDN
jgi:hypothetical protein